MSTPTPVPTPGFEFPGDSRDAIEQNLRSVIANGERQPLKSIRPERQPKPPTVVTPTVAPAVEAPAPIPEGNVKVQAPQTAHISEPEGISIELPSMFHYYSFKDLYIRPFRLSHLAKVAKANETSSMQTMAEVVSSVLSTPRGDQNIAFQLHMGDFAAVLFWLRIHSFSKKEMKVQHTCTNQAHIDDVKAGRKTPESLKITTLYREADLKFNFLKSAPNPDVFNINLPNYGRVDFRPETVSDVIDFMDHPDWEDAEFQFKARIASVLGMVHPDGTPYRLVEKLAMLDDMSSDDTHLALRFAEVVDDFGVNEIVQSNCIGCGASSAVKIAVDALSFLSS